MLWLEKLFKIKLSSTYCIDEETKARQRIQENLKIWQSRAQRAQKSKELRGQMQLLLKCPVWNVPEYLPTYFLS